MCLGQATAHAQMPGQSVNESRSRSGYWCSVKAAGGDCLLCEVERVTAGVNKATRLIPVIMNAKEARFADCTCMSGSWPGPAFSS